MNSFIPILMLLVSTGGIIFGYLLMRNPRILGMDIPGWVAWVMLVFGILGVLGFDIWLLFRAGS